MAKSTTRTPQTSQQKRGKRCDRGDLLIHHFTRLGVQTGKKDWAQKKLCASVIVCQCSPLHLREAIDEEVSFSVPTRRGNGFHFWPKGEFTGYNGEKIPEIEKESTMLNEHHHPEPLERLTEQARQVVNLSQEEARQLHHHWVGSEHLLLGLLCHDKGVAAKVLTAVGLELNQVREVIASGMGRGESIVRGEIALNPRAKKIIMRAVDEAEILGGETANAGHLLLGLIHEDASVSANAARRGHMSFLDLLGVNREDLRTQTLRLLSMEAIDRPAGEDTPARNLE